MDCIVATELGGGGNIIGCGGIIMPAEGYLGRHVGRYVGIIIGCGGFESIIGYGVIGCAGIMGGGGGRGCECLIIG